MQKRLMMLDHKPARMVITTLRHLVLLLQLTALRPAGTQTLLLPPTSARKLPEGRLPAPARRKRSPREAVPLGNPLQPPPPLLPLQQQPQRTQMLDLQIRQPPRQQTPRRSLDDPERFFDVNCRQRKRENLNNTIAYM